MGFSGRILGLKDRIIAHDARLAAQEERIRDLRLEGRDLVANAAEERLEVLKDTGRLMRERLRIMEDDKEASLP